MILTCQNCSTSFRLEERLLKPGGSKVRCSRCKHIWRARPPAEPESEQDGPQAADDQPGLGAAAGIGAAAMLAGADQTDAGGDDAAAESTPELRLGFDEPPATDQEDDEGDLVTDEINLGELDFLLEDESPPAGPEPEDEFKTEELNLADLEKMLDGEGDDAAAPAETDSSSAVDDLDALQEETDDSIIEELDLDMDDLESLLDEDSDLGDGIETPPAEKAPTDEIKLELAPELEDLLEEDAQEIGLEETEEVGLAEFDEADVDAEEAAPSGDGEIDLELAPGLDSLFDEAEDQDVPLDETEELDFGALEDALDQKAEAPEEDTDRDALAFDLDLEPADADTTPPSDADDDLELALNLDDQDAPSADDEVEALDLGDLERALQGDGTQTDQLSPGEEQPELVLELEGDTGEPSDLEDMDLELEGLDLGAPPADAGGIEGTRDLELEELENLLDDSEPPAQEAPPDAIEALELDLDLDDQPLGGEEAIDDATRELNLDDIEKILEGQDTAPAAPPAEGSDAEDLELDLDLGEDVPDSPPVEADLLEVDETTGGSDSLDLSELEKMLEVEDTTDSPAFGEGAPGDDLDLDFDLQPTEDEGEELDLQFDMLEDEGEASSALFDTSESEDLGLDLDVGETPPPEKMDLNDDLELEIVDEPKGEELDLDLVGEGADNLDLEIIDEGADDLDLEIIEEDEAPGAAPVAATAGSRDLTQELMDEMAAADTQTMDIPPAETKPIKPAPVPKKKGSSKSLVLLLLLVLLGAGGYFIYDTTGFDVSKFKLSDLPEIPFISAWLGAKQTPEAVVPVEASVKGNWVENSNDGRIYIIQGRVKNEYSEPRSYIRVTGQIFADGRKFQRTAQAYCGNMPTREEMENLPVAELQKQLGNRSGANNSNVMVPPGKEIPFTVIFAGLPEDVELQEYAVEISGSLPATKVESK
jgi:predicted Zn finger-like uncharacterized protein